MKLRSGATEDFSFEFYAKINLLLEEMGKRNDVNGSNNVSASSSGAVPNEIKVCILCIRNQNNGPKDKLTK